MMMTDFQQGDAEPVCRKFALLGQSFADIARPMCLHSGSKAVAADCYGQQTQLTFCHLRFKFENLQYFCCHLDLSNDIGTKSVEPGILFIRLSRSSNWNHLG